jgi:hypothetical protein
MVTELNVLCRFRRANHGKIFEGDTQQLVEQTNAYYESLQRNLKNIGSNRGYTNYFESWDPGVITEEEVIVDGLKHLFVTQTIDHRIEDALPLLAKIQQQGQAMKEANIFEAWAENLAEGTWATPDTPEKQKQLIDLLSKELTVGPDATNATEQLYNLLGDDELFDQLEALADQDPDADCRQVVTDRMDMLSDDPDIQAVVAQLQIEPEAEMNPAEPTDAGMSAPQDQAQVPDEPADDGLPEVPSLEEDNLEDILRIAGVPAEERPAPDYALEEGEMKRQMEADATRMERTKFMEKYGNEEWVGEFWDTTNGESNKTMEESALKGQYGHSGKLKSVEENAGFLTRLKELSGMIRN